MSLLCLAAGTLDSSANLVDVELAIGIFEGLLDKSSCERTIGFLGKTT